MPDNSQVNKMNLEFSQWLSQQEASLFDLIQVMGTMVMTMRAFTTYEETHGMVHSIVDAVEDMIQSGEGGLDPHTLKPRVPLTAETLREMGPEAYEMLSQAQDGIDDDALQSWLEDDDGTENDGDQDGPEAASDGRSVPGSSPDDLV